MSRKEVRRRQPSGSFFMPSPIPRRACREGVQSSRTPMWLPSHPALRCGCPVIPHFDAESREYRPWSADLFIITFFSLPNRLRCGHPVIPHLMRNPENTGKFTREILFPGPRIAVRADTVLDVVSRIYPLFIPKENSRQYRPGQKKAPIGRTGLRALLILYGNSVFKRFPRCSTHKQHLSGPRIMCGVTPLVMRSDAVSINIWGESYCCYSSYVMNWSPHRVRGDTKEAPPFALLSFF